MSDLIASDNQVDVLEEKPQALTATNDPPVSPATGLKILKEVWSASNRVATLVNEKYRGRAVPIDKLFGAIFGFGEEAPNPLEKVEKQLEEMNRKLDRIEQAIDEMRHELLGSEVLNTYLSMASSIDFIDNSFDALPNFVDGSKTEASKVEFIKNLLSIKDGVHASAQKILLIKPGMPPIFFSLLFKYLIDSSNVGNGYARYLHGAFIFRHIVDVLVKGMILELFASAIDPDTTKEETRVKNVKAVEQKYKGWFNVLIEQSLLPFAETLATLRFREEYMGGHSDTDMNIPWKQWIRPTASILESADTLAAQMLGLGKSVTLRVLPNVPPIADNYIPVSPVPHVTSAGTYRWSPLSTTPTALTNENLLDKLLEGGEAPFFIYGPKKRGEQTGGNEAWPGNPTRTTIQFAKGPSPTRAFKNQIGCLRYRYDLSAFGDGATFTFYQLPTKANKPPFAPITTHWEQIYDEEGHMWRCGLLDCTYHLLNEKFGEFELPAEGHMSPALITYTYERFGQRGLRQLLINGQLAEANRYH